MKRKVTLKERANEFRNDFEIYEGVLRCKFCNKAFNFQKKSILERHIKSDTHKNSKFGGIQTHLFSSNADNLKQILILETIDMLIKNDIPLKKFDTMKYFFAKNIINGGVLPNSCQLRKCYIPKYYNLQQDLIKEKLDSNLISLLLDESPDSLGRHVFITIARILSTGEYFLIDCNFLSNNSKADVYSYLNSVIDKYKFIHKNIISISTDSASYMKSVVNAFKEKMPHL